MALTPLEPAAAALAPPAVPQTAPLGASQDQNALAELGGMITPTLEAANARPMVGGGSVMAPEAQVRLLAGAAEPLVLQDAPGVVLSVYA